MNNTKIWFVLLILGCSNPDFKYPFSKVKLKNNTYLLIGEKDTLVFTLESDSINISEFGFFKKNSTVDYKFSGKIYQLNNEDSVTNSIFLNIFYSPNWPTYNVQFYYNNILLIDKTEEINKNYNISNLHSSNMTNINDIQIVEIFDTTLNIKKIYWNRENGLLGIENSNKYFVNNFQYISVTH